MATMTLRGIDDTMTKILKESAAKEGMSVNAFVLNTLKNVLNMGKKRRTAEYNDLDTLAGTWGEEDVTEFEKNTAAFEVVDDALWK
jgi:plasmid stability protein